MATGRIGTTPVLTTRWSKAPSAGTTSLSGLDDNSVSLVYSVGYEAVYQNGVLLSRGNDYTATNGTTITLTTATVAGDIIEVFANQTIPLTDTYSQTVSDGRFIKNTLTTTTGDIIYASAANTPARLGIGSTSQVLTVSGGVPTWATPAGGGKVLQVVQGTTSTPVTNTGASYVDSGLTASITPSATSSKILVLVTQNMEIGGTEDAQATVKLVRGSTSLISDYYMEDYQQSRTASTQIKHIASLHYLDSPSTTSSTTYKTQIVKSGGTGITAQSASQTSTIILLEIGA